ncbi:MAG: hypothetical protein IKM83_00465 [Paludibacteraceae bacterium]|nr:hypothetical protein [Paludibacteraceae bacterium]
MSLLNSLYDIVESQKSKEQSTFVIRFNPSHPIFAGHFPGHPVVPGAVLVQIAEELVGVFVGSTVCFNAIRNLKFRQPITPDMEVTLCIEKGVSDHFFNVQLSTFNSLNASFIVTYMCPDTDLQ